MAVSLVKATEGGTYVVTASFFDPTGAAIIPKTLVWSLTDIAGATINARRQVPVVNPTSVVDVVLTGADLAVPEGRDSLRVLTVEAVYDSLTYGSNLTLKGVTTFTVQNLTAVPHPVVP